MDETGVVDEDIEPAFVAAHPIEQGLHLAVVRMIHAHRNALAAGGRNRCCGFVDRAGQRRVAGLSPRRMDGAAMSAERNRNASIGAAATTVAEPKYMTALRDSCSKTTNTGVQAPKLQPRCPDG